MKPIIEKLPLAGNRSFVAKTHATPQFEVPWHQHIEYELILFTKGEGTSYIGNYVGSFSTGDVFFLGSNLPHTFQKKNKDLFTSAVVVHFKKDFWGAEFIELPETRIIRQLLELSASGIRVTGQCRQKLQSMIPNLEFCTGFSSIIELCKCLQVISTFHCLRRKHLMMEDDYEKFYNIGRLSPNWRSLQLGHQVKTDQYDYNS